MSQFDLLVILLLSVSGLIGCLRGVAREVMTVLAFVLALTLSTFTLRYTGAFLGHWVHPIWAANSIAAMVVFVAIYLGVRIIGARLAHTVRRHDSISLLDRVGGLGFGLFRALVMLGVFQLVLNAAAPGDRTPKWIAEAKLYPLAVDSGHALRALAPQGSAVAGQFAPSLEHAVAENPDSASSDQPQEKSQ